MIVVGFAMGHLLLRRACALREFFNHCLLPRTAPESTGIWERYKGFLLIPRIFDWICKGAT
ncbi:MAG TPA: hypothetical protein DHC76_11540 [Rhodobacteraceae bacterium]|nr:hypothetical protein [Paracoccaceae bacterium]